MSVKYVITHGNKMIVNVNSWHYKWASKIWDKNPKSLCSYFWKVVFTFTFMGCLSLAAVVFGLVGLMIIFYPILQIWFTDLGVAIVSFLFWAFAGFAVSYQYREYLRHSGKVLPKLVVEHGLVHQYLDAKHRKVCPLIEYKDE